MQRRTFFFCLVGMFAQSVTGCAGCRIQDPYGRVWEIGDDDDDAMAKWREEEQRRHNLRIESTHGTGGNP